jgi:pyrroline-5-carboxylate reductase
MERLSQTIGFIGAGNMARAIAAGIVRCGLVGAEQVVASDVSPDQLSAFSEIGSVRTTQQNGDVVNAADIIVFAVKPYQMDEVCRGVAKLVRPDQLFISICAGIPTHFIESHFGSDSRVVRVMPNTPALLGAGAAAVSGGKKAAPGDLDVTRRMFESVGKVVQVEEDKLDLITGLTGSGPAYFFRFMEAMIEAGTELGLRPDDARTLVIQTALGAARMASESGKALHELRNAVTTKGGTTEAGLKVLEEGDLPELILNCVSAATARSRELSKGK